MDIDGKEPFRIALIGLGTIGISFAALHLQHGNAVVSVFDTRPDLEKHVSSLLPRYIDSDDPLLAISQMRLTSKLKFCLTLEEACRGCNIVQEQGPENLAFKRSTWCKIERLVSPDTHLWSSTSGIPASLQGHNMNDKTRLLVVHPFNPPHIMPLIEIIPAPTTAPTELSFAYDYFQNLSSGHRPIIQNKEIKGFVGNRLAYALLREACYLVAAGVISVQDLDTLVESSIGPRWAIEGPFKSYNHGGGEGGLEKFFNNLKGTIQDVWDDYVPLRFGEIGSGNYNAVESWEELVVRQTAEAYGRVSPTSILARDAALRRILQLQR